MWQKATQQKIDIFEKLKQKKSKEDKERIRTVKTLEKKKRKERTILQKRLLLKMVKKVLMTVSVRQTLSQQ